MVGSLQALVAAHATLATLAGTVRDAETGAPLAGAVVVIEQLGRVAATDSAGRYVLAQLPSGSFVVIARYRGYTERSLQALIPSDGRLEIDIALPPMVQLLPPLEVVVSASPPSVTHPASSATDRTLSISRIRNDPMLAEPDAFAALHGGAVTLEQETPAGLHVRGGATDQTAYLLDGIPVLSPYHAAGVVSAWNPDLLSEVGLATPASSSTLVDAASGAVEGWTRPAGSRVGTHGSVSTAQARIAVDGPIGRGGMGFLLGLRSRVPNAVVPDGDPTYLDASARDWFAKVEIPAGGGLVRLLAYDNHNALDALAAIGSVDAPDVDALRNQFSWNGHSLGASWSRSGARTAISVRAWNATAATTAAWAVSGGSTGLNASRNDYGLSAGIERRTSRAATSLGARMVFTHSTYAVATDNASGRWQLEGNAPIATMLVRQVRGLGSTLELDLGFNLSTLRGSFYPAPRIGLSLTASPKLAFSGSVSRTWQFTQSLRNNESVVAGIFPAELYVSAAAPGVPVLRSDLAVLGARLQPSPVLWIATEIFARSDAGLLLVAPVSGQPYATGRFAVGDGSAQGGSMELGWRVARLEVTTSYAVQRVRYQLAGSSYVPGFGTAHQLELGVAFNPSSSWSLRLGVVGAAGRTATTVSGGLEWEACNLLDRGCEFAGSPSSSMSPGNTVLPAYARVDLGVRKQWNVAGHGRAGTIAVFGTITNLLGRNNVLTYDTDPTSGQLTPVEMRPWSPLVVGMDWSF